MPRYAITSAEVMVFLHLRFACAPIRDFHPGTGAFEISLTFGRFQQVLSHKSGAGESISPEKELKMINYDKPQTKMRVAE